MASTFWVLLDAVTLGCARSHTTQDGGVTSSHVIQDGGTQKSWEEEAATKEEGCRDHCKFGNCCSWPPGCVGE